MRVIKKKKRKRVSGNERPVHVRTVFKRHIKVKELVKALKGYDPCYVEIRGRKLGILKTPDDNEYLTIIDTVVSR